MADKIVKLKDMSTGEPILPYTNTKIVLDDSNKKLSDTLTEIKTSIDAKAPTSHTHTDLQTKIDNNITGTDKNIVNAINSNADKIDILNTTVTDHIESHLALGETSTTAYRGDRGKIAYDHSQVAHATATAQKNSDITKVEIEAKLTGVITTHSHNYATQQDVINAIDSISTIPEGNLILRDVLPGEIFDIQTETTPAITYGQIVLNKTSLTIVEGNAGEFTVALDKAPTNNQVVTLSKTNADVTLSATSLTFTPSNFATPQKITVSVANDDTDYSNESDVITLLCTGVSSVQEKTVSVSITDNDTAPSNIPVTGVTVSPTTATITSIGGIQQLTATITPQDATNKAVTWSSSNTAIATVDNTGKVTSVANGSVTITCTAQDTTNNAKGTCSITVQASVEPPVGDIVADGLEVWWQGDSYTGKTLTDKSGKGRDITLDGATTFDGTKITFAGSGKGVVAIPQTNILTLEFVVKYNATTITTRCSPVSTLQHTGSSGIGYRITSSFIDSMDYGTSGGSRVTPTGAYVADAPYQWRAYKEGDGVKHFVVRYNTSNKRFEVIVNGTQNYRYFPETTTFNPSVDKIALGMWSTIFTENDLNNTELYCVRAYSRMLSDAEILQNYNASYKG